MPGRHPRYLSLLFMLNFLLLLLFPAVVFPPGSLQSTCRFHHFLRGRAHLSVKLFVESNGGQGFWREGWIADKPDKK